MSPCAPVAVGSWRGGWLRRASVFVAVGAVSMAYGGNPPSPPIGEATRNLLPNAAFTDSTNPGVADNWDIQHVALLKIPEIYSDYHIDASETPPLAGTKVIRIRNRTAAFQYLNLGATRLTPSPPPGDYTFSVYLRSDDPGVAANFTSAIGCQRYYPLGIIGRAWRRFSVAFQLLPDSAGACAYLQPTIYFPNAATYYVAAPQLEPGATMTPFHIGARAQQVIATGAASDASRSSACATGFFRV